MGVRCATSFLQQKRNASILSRSLDPTYTRALSFLARPGAGIHATQSFWSILPACSFLLSSHVIGTDKDLTPGSAHRTGFLDISELCQPTGRERALGTEPTWRALMSGSPVLTASPSLSAWWKLPPHSLLLSWANTGSCPLDIRSWEVWRKLPFTVGRESSGV